MNKNKAFSVIEVIVSVFILMIVLIPSARLNIKQFETFNTVQKNDSTLYFLNSLNNYMKNNYKNISNNIHFDYNNSSEFLRDFDNFKNMIPKHPNENFKLSIQLKEIEVNFYNENKKAVLGTINFSNNSKNFEKNFIKFEE